MNSEEKGTGSAGKRLRILPFATHTTRGLIRDQGTRRKIMFGTVVLAVALVAAGATVLEGVIDHRTHPVWFILYWFACGWLAVLAMLLALFDVLIVRAQARAARNALGRQIAGPETQDSPSERSDG